MLEKAIANVIQAYGGTDKLSELAKIHYEKLNFALSQSGFPELYSLAALLDEMGFHLAVTVKSDN
jgi:DNA-binding phage protein